ncbi:MAG TPA: hypothetical protein V6D30_22610 [Leptolyngbyaceae cyanobacterium]
MTPSCLAEVHHKPLPLISSVILKPTPIKKSSQHLLTSIAQATCIDDFFSCNSLPRAFGLPVPTQASFGAD